MIAELTALRVQALSPAYLRTLAVVTRVPAFEGARSRSPAFSSL